METEARKKRRVLRVRKPPPGMRRHSWVAALTIHLSENEVRRFHAKATSEVGSGTPWGGKVQLERPAEVLDCYCERCGTRPTREEWCPWQPAATFGLPSR